MFQAYRTIVLAVTLGILAGCGTTLAQRQAELAPLIGRPVNDLIQQLGVPNRTYDAQGVRYLAYDERQVQFCRACRGPGFGPAVGGAAAFRPRWCSGSARRRSPSPAALFDPSASMETRAAKVGYQPPNQTPTPWTMPIGKNSAPAINNGRRPAAEQNTIEVSQAE